MPRETRQAKKTGKGSGPAVKLPSSKKKEAVSNGDGDATGTEIGSELTMNPPEITDESGPSNGTKKVRRAANEKTAAVVNSSSNANGVNDNPVIHNNLLKNLDLLQYGRKGDRSLCIKTIQNHFVNKSIKQLTADDFTGRFSRRITSIAWHEKYPYILACASKFGDTLFISGCKPPNENDLKFVAKVETFGAGAGASITAMKFHPEEMSTLYRASIDCMVLKVDMSSGHTVLFHDTNDYNRWFCALDTNFPNKIICAGDNKGTGYKFSMDGKLLSTWRLHKSKIHHIEFSRKDTNIMVTSSLDKNEAVRIWDVRFMKDSGQNSTLKPLKTIPHASALNCAKFNPTDGSRLLTSDQNDEIRVYQGPLWMDYLTIKHHHKQFQHITPVKADWHPVNDYIVVGRYPHRNESQKLARAIEFYDSYSGKLVDMIYPPLDEICSLNVFNCTGEYLATGMNSKLILWKPGVPMDVAENSKQVGGGSSQKISDSVRNVLRGRRAREYSPDGSEADNEDDEDTSRKKKKSKTANTSTSSRTTKTATATKSTSTRKKK